MNEDKLVHVNQKAYDEIVKRLGYEPSNLVLNPLIEDNQAVVMDEDFLKFKPFIY